MQPGVLTRAKKNRPADVTAVTNEAEISNQALVTNQAEICNQAPVTNQAEICNQAPEQGYLTTFQC